VLGPQDQITVRVRDVEEFSDKPFRIATDGTVNLPIVGRLQAAGLTLEQLEADLAERLKVHVKQPEVAVSVAEYHSQPVSVIGSVNNPGVHQLQGSKTLVELLSMAGGLRPDAGHCVKIIRRLENGPIPLPGATDDPSGQFSVAQLNLKTIMEAKNPEQNILIQPKDIISVPRAELVYVIGEVKKPGGFVLNDDQTMSVLKALSLAEGFGRTAASQSAKIVRNTPGALERSEIPVDLKKILAGKATDVALQPDDILFIPNSTAKNILIRSADIATTIAAGAIIYRNY
jgi:polysaccharide export outer membrane protein